METKFESTANTVNKLDAKQCNGSVGKLGFDSLPVDSNGSTIGDHMTDIGNEMVLGEHSMTAVLLNAITLLPLISL